MDRARLGAAAGLVFLVASADAKRRLGASQCQLRLGHERRRPANLGAAVCLVCRTADRIAADRLCADAFRAGARHAQSFVMLAPATKPSPLLPLHFAWRELRGGLRGFGV